MAFDAEADFKFLEAAARRSIDDLRRAVHSVPTEPQGRGAQFLRVVEATLDALDARVDARKTGFLAARDSAERDKAIRLMQMTNLDVLAFHSYTPWIESTRATPLGLGFIYFIKRMVSVLLQHSADLVVTPSTDYMYETIYKPFEPALRRLRGTYPDGPPPIIIAYPIQEPDSLFLHLIVAHELGHSVIHENDLTETVRNSASSEARALLSKAASEYASIATVDLAEAEGQVSDILSNWIAEVLCDGFALGLLGPSFVLTAASFDPPFGGPKPSDTHPPFNLRTRFLLERLNSWGWRALLESAIPSAIRSWIEGRAALPQETEGKDYFLTLEQTLEELSAKIEEEIERHLGAHRFKPDDYSDDDGRPARELRELLDNQVLPVQLSDALPASGSAIILAGWLHALSNAKEPAALVGIVDDHGFQRFLTKALEMSAILEHWRAADAT